MSVEVISSDYRLESKNRRVKYYTTFAIYLGNFGFGCAFNTYGPVLEYLRNKYDTDISSISLVFNVIAISYLIGGLSSGFIYRFINRQLGVILVLSGIAISSILTPHLDTLYAFFINAAVLSVCCGCYEPTQVVWVIQIWEEEAHPFIQAQHFFHAFGTLVTPLLFGIYFSNNVGSDLTDSSSNAVIDATDRSLIVPFTIVGILAGLAALTQVLLFIFARYESVKKNLDVTDKVKSNQSNGSINWSRAQLLLLTAIFLGTYQGMEICTMQFLSTFATSVEHKLSESQAAYLLSAHSGAHTVGRVIGIFGSLKVRPQFILLGNICLIICSSAILMVFANISSEMVWVGSIILGFGFSTVMASFCGFMERHLMFTNLVGTVIIVSGSIVASIFSLIIGNYIEHYPIVMNLIIMFGTLCCIVSFLIIYVLIIRKTNSNSIYT